MNLVIPSTEFLIYSYAAGAVLILIGSLALRSQFRVENAPSWIGLVLLGPLPALLGISAAELAYLPGSTMLPPVCISALMGVVWVHWLLPKILPDFQTESFTASATLGAMMGIAALIGGILSDSFPGGIVA